MDLTTVGVHVHRWGIGNRRRALLVHGVAANGAGWWRVAEGLARHGFDVSAPDLRGHGSSPGATTFTFDAFALDLRELGDAWDVVVGHSLGGPIVCTLLGLGVTAARVVLVDPVLDIADADFDEVAQAQVAGADPFADPRELAAAYPTWHPLDAHHKAAAVRAVSSWTVERAMYDNAPWHHVGLASTLTMPTVLLGSDPVVSTMFPEDLARSIAAGLPDARFAVVPGTGHAIHREAPDAIVSAAVGP